MCRARFEVDDAFEADVICNGRPQQTSSSERKEGESVGLMDMTPGQRREYYYTLHDTQLS